MNSTNFQPPNIVEDTSLRDRAYEVLKDAIMNLELPPGYPLVERELAAQFGISKTPIRDAIGMLATEGLVVRPLYKSAYVSIPSADELRDVFEVRTELESLAIRKLCQRVEPNLWEQARSILDESDAFLSQGDFANAVARGQDFHFVLIDAVDNEFLRRVLHEIDVRIVRVRKLLSRLPSNVAKSNAEHRQLLAAIASGHGDQATATLRKHLADALEVFLEAFEEASSEFGIS